MTLLFETRDFGNLVTVAENSVHLSKIETFIQDSQNSGTQFSRVLKNVDNIMGEISDTCLI